MSKIRIDGRIVLITGASRGLGRSMAQALAAAGARVVLASPEGSLLRKAAAEIGAEHGPECALAVPTDVTRREDCERVVAESLRHFGGLHVLINNARRSHRGPGLPNGNEFPFWMSDPDLWRQTVDVNVTGAFLIAHSVAPHLVGQGWGRIINVSTSLDTMQRKNNSPYGVTKAALEAATLIWAQDLEGTGVTVNSLIPGGYVHTQLEGPPPSDRKALPVDIMNEAAIWLCSPLSDGKTGGRYVGKLWDARLPPNEAARHALEEPVLRAPSEKTRSR
jgi:NAD(P)-dependent dehydrogenase (short-subunit alcohol dehydrogenase family)